MFSRVIIISLSVLLINVTPSYENMVPGIQYQMEVVRCTREAEEYFNTQNDLITQQIQKYPPPPPLFKTKYDECISNNTAKANLLLSALSSKKLLSTADCLENGANNYTFNSTLTAKYDAAIAFYKNQTKEFPPANEKVNLTICKCEQSKQISSYGTFLSLKRAACKTLANTVCSTALSKCTSNVTSVFATKEAAIRADQNRTNYECQQYKPTTISVTPTTRTTVH